MDGKPIVWIASSRNDVRRFPRDARRKAGLELRAMQRGQEPTDYKPIPSVGPGVYEIRIRAQDIYRVFYVARFEEVIYVLHAFQKKTQKTAKYDIEIGVNVIKRSSSTAGRGHKARGIQLTHGSDNVFEDVGFKAEEAANLKIRADLLLDLRQYIQTRGWTQTEAADFFGETQPRISNLLKGEIGRFSIDKLIVMLARAGIRVRLEIEPQAA